MKKSNISIMLLFLIFISVFIATRDWNSSYVGAKEIDEIDFVQVAGVDFKNGKYLLTIVSESFQQQSEDSSSNNSSSGKNNNVFAAEGKTIFEASQNFEYICGQHLDYGHSKCIVIGEAAAKKNIGEILDLFLRNHENRLDVDVLIARDITANQLFLKMLGGGDPVNTKVGKVFENVGELSLSRKVILSELVNMLDNDYASAYMPYIQLVYNPYDLEEKEGSEDAKVDGFAVLKDKELFAYINQKTSRGVNWITDDIQNAILVIKDDTDKDISMEVIQTKTEIQTEFSGALPQVTIKIEMTANIGEQQSDKNIYTKEQIDRLIKRQNEAVKYEVNQALSFCQSNKLDILGIGDAVYHKSPIKWEKIKKNWQQKVFPPNQNRCRSYFKDRRRIYGKRTYRL